MRQLFLHILLFSSLFVAIFASSSGEGGSGKPKVHEAVTKEKNAKGKATHEITEPLLEHLYEYCPKHMDELKTKMKTEKAQKTEKKKGTEGAKTEKVTKNSSEKLSKKMNKDRNTVRKQILGKNKQDSTKIESKYTVVDHCCEDILQVMKDGHKTAKEAFKDGIKTQYKGEANEETDDKKKGKTEEEQKKKTEKKEKSGGKEEKQSKKELYYKSIVTNSKDGKHNGKRDIHICLAVTCEETGTGTNKKVVCKQSEEATTKLKDRLKRMKQKKKTSTAEGDEKKSAHQEHGGHAGGEKNKADKSK